MPAEIALSDGTKITTDTNTSSDDVLKRLEGPASFGFVAITDTNGDTYRVQPANVVYVRDKR